MRVVNIATILAALSCLVPICCGAYQDSTLSTILGANTKYSEQRCDSSSDCNGEDKICHENRCICSKEKPIEDQDRCLPQALIGEQCSIESQCLVDSLCIDGICACGIDAVSIYNPSSRLFYCQPKRGLNEECNSDLQCPLNAYCSGSRGCLCSNGFSPANVSNAGVETTECLPKTCSSTSDCEEYHQCDENRCKCLPLHFDVSRAKCYKYGAKLLSGDQANQEGDSKNSAPTNHLADDFISILKDLTSRTSDNLWLVLIILIALSLLLLILILSLLRKHYLGYCWTAHKKEYEPNTAKQQAPRNGHFDKNSINNKSFRRRNGEMDDDAENDSSTEDKSNLVAKKTTIFNNNNTSSSRSSRNQGDFVTVNLNGKEEDNESPASEHRRLHQGPLKSSTSTPV